MPGTPQRRAPVSPHARTPRTPGPCPYKGLEVVVPGDIFDQPGVNETAVVRGWNNRRSDQVVVQFEDGTKYWFPLADVLAWLGPAAAATAEQTAAAATAADAPAPPTPLSPATTPAAGTRRRSTRLAAAAAAQADTAPGSRRKVRQALVFDATDEAARSTPDEQHATGTGSQQEQQHRSNMQAMAWLVLAAAVMIGLAVLAYKPERVSEGVLGDVQEWLSNVWQTVQSKLSWQGVQHESVPLAETADNVAAVLVEAAGDAAASLADEAEDASVMFLQDAL